ncbi:MAG: hypothetical protein CMN31_12570 [Sandaracinus sp.]|nr:hypothetical protein [Sandaracinus sp.]MBJ72155.1 hypothetical protein [Sandaracinus sp.]
MADSASAASSDASSAALSAGGVWATPAPLRMRYDLILLDFDGTFTDVEKEADPFFASYKAEVRELIGGDVDGDWAEAVATLEQNPGEFGWVFEGQVVAPGNADPYLRATVILNMIFDRRGLYPNEAERTELLQGLYFRNYPKADTVFRANAKQVVETLLASPVPTMVVTNSATDDVEAKIDRMAPTGRERLKVYGNAKKYIVAEPDESDACFERVPETMRAEGLERDILLRRGRYYELLRTLWKETGVKPERTLVAGDIFELDLALPGHLGADVHLVLKDKTQPFERAAVKAMEGGAESPGLEGILERAGL